MGEPDLSDPEELHRLETGGGGSADDPIHIPPPAN